MKAAGGLQDGRVGHGRMHAGVHLQQVVEDDGRAESKAAAIDSALDCVDHVRARLKDVWPHVVQQVCQSVLAAHASHAQRHVLHH